MAAKLIENYNGTNPQFIGSTERRTGANGLTEDSNYTITAFLWADDWGDSTTGYIQVSPDSEKWFTVAETSTGSNLAVNMALGGGVFIRGVFEVAGTAVVNGNIQISD